MAALNLTVGGVTYTVDPERFIQHGVFGSNVRGLLTALAASANGTGNVPFTPVVVANGATVTLGAGTNYLAPAATIAGAVINLPTSPQDGEYVAVSTTNQITAVTGTLNSTLGVSELTAGQVVKYRYNLATTTWFHA